MKKPGPKRASLIPAKSWHVLGSPLGTVLGDITLRELEAIEIPAELETLSREFAQFRVDRVEDHLREPAVYFTSRDGGCEAYAELMLTKYGTASRDVSESTIEIVEDALQSAFRAGFYLAVIRYADELKNVPEAVAVLNQKRKAAYRGGEAKRKKAQPRHKDIRGLFRDLRKTSPKKTVRYRRVAEKFGMSERQIARIVEGLD